MNWEKMIKDFCKAALPSVFVGAIAGFTSLCNNHDSYYKNDHESEEQGE